MSKKNVALATVAMSTLISSSAFAQDAAGGVGGGAQAAAAIGAGIAIGLAESFVSGLGKSRSV